MTQFLTREEIELAAHLRRRADELRPDCVAVEPAAASEFRDARLLDRAALAIDLVAERAMRKLEAERDVAKIVVAVLSAVSVVIGGSLGVYFGRQHALAEVAEAGVVPSLCPGVHGWRLSCAEETP